MKKEPKFKDTTDLCLADFFRRFGKSKALIEFAKVTPDTEGTWRNHRVMPEGETLLRVRCFLRQCGYEVAELNVSPELLEVAQCIANDCISVEKVAERLSITKPRQFFRYFRGISPSLERTDTLKAIAAECRQGLQARVCDLQRQLEVENIIRPTPPALVHNGSIRSELIKEFASACEKVFTSGRLLLVGPRAQRDEMRNCIGSGSEPLLHCTWEVLNKLLNENTQQKKGQQS